jgi:hypothetical protein
MPQLDKIDKVFTGDLTKVADFGDESLHESTRILKRLGKSSLILDKTYYGKNVRGGSGRFVDQPKFEEGRGDNRHNVRFGELFISPSDALRHSDFIAAKPTLDKNGLSDIVNEFTATNYLNLIGDIQNSYLPLGFWKNAEGIVSLVTLYEHGTKTYDSVFWADKDISPEALRPEVIQRALLDCVWGLGYLHAAGLIHGDAQVKNHAHDGRNVRFVDLESVTRLEQTDHGIIDTIENDVLRIRDLDQLISSTMMVEENRRAVGDILFHQKTLRNLSQHYIKGWIKGAKDSQLESVTPSLTDVEATLSTVIDKYSKLPLD